MRVAHNPHTQEEIKITREHAYAPQGEIYHLENIRFMLFTEIAEALGFECWELDILAGRTANTISVMFTY